MTLIVLWYCRERHEFRAQHKKEGRPIDQTLQRVRDFIGADPPKQTDAFLSTFRKNGQPFIRQISVLVDGWTVQAFTSATKLMVAQLHTNPNAMFLWAEMNPPARRRNVWMNGTAELSSDPDEIMAFLQRRNALGGRPGGQGGQPGGRQRGQQPRVEGRLITFRPTFLRAEGFRSDLYTAMMEPKFILREFAA